MTTEVFLSFSLSNMPGSRSLASLLNSFRNPSANAPAHAHASPTHAMFESFVIIFFNARVTSPYSEEANFGFEASCFSWVRAPRRSFHLELVMASQNFGCSLFSRGFSNLSRILKGSANSYASGSWGCEPGSSELLP